LSPLYGSRTVLMVHDELIAETPTANADAGARELARLMIRGANKVLPDVPITEDRMEPLAMAIWSKDAKTLEDAGGKIVPWSYALEGLLEMGKVLKERTFPAPFARTA
jgi:DNA polymerase-1